MEIDVLEVYKMGKEDGTMIAAILGLDKEYEIDRAMEWCVEYLRWGEAKEEYDREIDMLWPEESYTNSRMQVCIRYLEKVEGGGYENRKVG